MGPPGCRPDRGSDAVLWLSIAVAVFYLIKNGLLGLFAYAHRKVISESQASLARRLAVSVSMD